MIDFLNGKLLLASASWLQQATDRQLLALPVIARIELLSWRGSAAEMQLLQQYIATTTLLGLDEPVVQQTIRLRQQHKVKLPDALVAAAALVAGLPLLTRNTQDFKRLAPLAVLNPHAYNELPAL